MSGYVIMNNNILVIFMRIAAFLLLFTLCYSLLLDLRFRRRKDLIISRDSLGQLFTKTQTLEDACQGHNGDIWIETVAFENDDFDVSEDIVALEKSLYLLRNGGANK